MTFSKTLRTLGSGLGALFLSVACAQAADPVLQTFALKNGLQVVLLESHRVPAVTHMLWYRVGAADDFPGRSGLAHYNEHMMFQGTDALGVGEYLRRVSAYGGRANAFTSRDFTAFYVTIAKERLPMVMEMEADRMQHLKPTPANFAKEREVIIEERRMTVDNKPDALLEEEMQAALFRNHPYHNPIIGWMREMQSLSEEDVLSFQRRFYHPANLTLIVVGDITRAELENMAEKYYGAIPAGERYERSWREEPPQRAPRHVALSHPNVRQPALIRFYAAPSFGTDRPELVLPGYVLAQILGGGTTSRLYQSLVVKQKLATGVSVDFDGFNNGPAIMQVNAVPADGVSLAKLEAALDRELAAFLAAPPAPDELFRAKTLLKAETIYARDGIESMARILGYIVMAGLPADYFTQWQAKVDAVTAAQIRDAAKAAFDPRASVTGYLLPEGKPQ